MGLNLAWRAELARPLGFGIFFFFGEEEGQLKQAVNYAAFYYLYR